jgi:hypothetical protein
MGAHMFGDPAYGPDRRCEDRSSVLHGARLALFDMEPEDRNMFPFPLGVAHHRRLARLMGARGDDVVLRGADRPA